ncbi:MAG: cobalamin-dependent protein [Deltaproteobacteria bacterium]|nr:cobalamin-dependent protein [Deltaproteobacteria bacterium]
MPDEKLITAVSQAEDDIVFKIIQEKVDSGEDLTQVLHDLTEGMKLLGERFSTGEAFIPEVVFGADVFKQAIEMIRPQLGDLVDKRETKGKVALATVKGDVHDIGKGLVAIFLDLAGYEIIDLGHDVPNEKILEVIENQKPHVVGLSALMTTTMLQQKELIKLLKEKGLRDRVKVIVGGAPIYQKWADEIGADAFGADALDGRIKIDSLI